VRRVRRRHVNGVDVGIGHQVLIRAMAPRDGELVPEPVGRLLGARTNGHDPARSRHGHVLGKNPGNVPRTDHSPAQRAWPHLASSLS
jgi:hypothetical protein